MKLFVKKILFISTVIVGIIATLLLCRPLHTQSDLMSLMDTSDIAQQWPTKDVSEKFSSVINIVTESENEIIARESANKIVKLLNTEQFNMLNVQSDNFSLTQVTKDFIPYKNAFGFDTPSLLRGIDIIAPSGKF